jgi:hypothetical protein
MLRVEEFSVRGIVAKLLMYLIKDLCIDLMIKMPHKDKSLSKVCSIQKIRFVKPGTAQ